MHDFCYNLLAVEALSQAGRRNCVRIIINVTNPSQHVLQHPDQLL